MVLYRKYVYQWFYTRGVLYTTVYTYQWVLPVVPVYSTGFVLEVYQWFYTRSIRY